MPFPLGGACVYVHPRLWTPAEISGELAAWWDFSDETTISEADAAGRISAITSKGPGNTALQTTPGDQPVTGSRTINGLNAGEFNGADAYLDFTGINYVDKMIFIVTEIDDISGLGQLISHSSVNIQCRHNLGVLEYAGAANAYISGAGAGAVVSAYSLSVGTPAVVGYIFDSDLGFTKDGAVATAGLSRANTNSQLLDQIGMRSGSGEPYDGLVGEILITDILSDADRDRVIGYLAWKFKFPGQLVGGHAYEDAPPFKNA